MPYFTKEQEENAVALILKECNSFRHDDKSSRSMSYVERDSEGYVVGLVDLGLRQKQRALSKEEETGNQSFSQEGETPKIRHWSMPPSIGYLTRLRKLTVYHCKSLPREIIHLSESLEEIAFHFCDELDFDALPPEFECLDQMIDFRIHGRTATAQRILPIHRLQRFSNLRYLYYRGGSCIDFDTQDIDRINEKQLNPDQEIFNRNYRLIQDLTNESVQFKNSLEMLEIEGGDLDEFSVAMIFSQILPRYPNLKRLILPNNQIRSLSPIIPQQAFVAPPTIRLKCFYLVGNPVLDLASATETLHLEQTNLLRLLTRYEEIMSLGHGITESGLCTTEMLLALDLNDGGKILLSERFKPIPLSVWPVVLERVNQRKGYYDSTNVLYHLLRNGPALGKRNKNYNGSNARDYSPITAALDADEMIASVGIPPLSKFSPSFATPVAVSSDDRTPRKRKISMP